MTGVLLAGLVATMIACEDSDVTAPEGSTITLTPTPGFVLIDQDADETEGQTTLVAQVTDGSGLPVDGLPLVFTSDGGLLGSVTNICTLSGTCSRDFADCQTDADCAVVTGPPDVRETNDSGVAADVLKLRLFEDPDVVNVTVKGTSLEATAAVAKTVNTGPIDPVAAIEVTPSGGQRSGVPFAVDGTGSTFDPEVEPTCFEWTITDAEGSEILRGPSKSIIPDLVVGLPDVPGEQDITILLRVSDEPDINCTQDADPPPSDEEFSDFGAVISYEIKCDFTPPQVLPIGDEERSLSGEGGEVDLTLSATAFDPEFSDEELEYRWDCDNADTDMPVGATVTCTYTEQGNKTPFVTLSNPCNESTQRGLTVQILQ
jgi:hypothetical protein